RGGTTTFSIAIARPICSWSKPSLEPAQGTLTTVSGVHLPMFRCLPPFPVCGRCTSSARESQADHESRAVVAIVQGNLGPMPLGNSLADGWHGNTVRQVYVQCVR